MLYLCLATKKQSKSQGCVVDNATYYCKIEIENLRYPAGVYCINTESNKSPSSAIRLELMRYSHKVWREGPKGGIKIVKNRHGLRRYQYITQNPRAMEEFMWIKLSAKALA